MVSYSAECYYSMFLRNCLTMAEEDMGYKNHIKGMSRTNSALTTLGSFRLEVEISQSDESSQLVPCSVECYCNRILL